MKRTDKKINKNVLLCIGTLFLLIVCAFITPGLLLGIQDKKRLTQSVGTSNAEIANTIWQENYETDTTLRLQNLANGLAGGKQYYVSKQNMDENEEGQIADIIDKYVISAEWNYVLQDIGLLPEDYVYKKGLHNASICKYILYDEKLTDGVAIMSYDIKLQIQDDANGSVNMEFIIDSETGTLYALKMILEDETETLTWEDMSIDSDYLYSFMSDYWQSYYTYESSGSGKNIELPENANVLIYDATGYDTGKQGSTNKYSFQLTYGTEHLQFQLALLNASKGELDKGVGFIMGIREIEELIPDFLPENF